MATHKFYVQSPYVEAATLTDLTGTSSTRANMLNYRKGSLCNVDTVSTSEYAWKIDIDPGATGLYLLDPTFVGFINHSLYTTETGSITILYGSTDNGTLWDTTKLSVTAAVATDEPIWVKEIGAANEKRFWKISITSIAATAYWGCFFFGAYYAPSVDCNYQEPVQYDFGGTTLNTTSGGARYAVQRFADRPIHSFHYELIPTADKDILVNLKTAVGGNLKPFIFAIDDGGTTRYKYGRLGSGGMQVAQTAAGLWDVRFLIEEEL